MRGREGKRGERGVEGKRIRENGGRGGIWGKGAHTICQAGPIIMKINLFSIG